MTTIDSSNSFPITSFSTPFNPTGLEFDSTNTTWIELKEKSKIYSLAVNYIAKNLAAGGQSFQIEEKKSTGKKNLKPGNITRTGVLIGLGIFSFVATNGKIYRALHQAIGDPVGSDCGIGFYKSLVVFAPETNAELELSQFCTDLIEASETTEGGTFTIFTWHLKYQYWKTESKCRARPVESVILPAAVKQKILGDLEAFLSEETQQFFHEHGIPYKRSYLFYGVPGAGKTSLVQALAGRFERNLCYLQPTHPEMTDDSLRAAITNAPDDAIIVLEDVDSLFSKDRKNSSSHSSLTFSGLLNALDGVGNPNGQIFVLSTNLREQLDGALIRNGRVDLHVEFLHATPEQIRDMWRSFYPASKTGVDLGEQFAEAVVELLGTRQITTAGLQHFFVTHRGKSAHEALASVHTILDDLKEKEVRDANEAQNCEEDGAKPPGGKPNKKSSKNGGDGSFNVHFHGLESIVPLVALGMLMTGLFLNRN